MADVIEIRSYEPTEKQKQAHESSKRYVLFGGAMGGGKSRWISEHMNRAMLRWPGNRGFIGRKRYSDFATSTYLILQKVLSPYIQAGKVVENKGRKIFQYYNGSELFYGQFDDDVETGTNRLFSSEFGIIGGDEAWELSETQFKKAGTRLRHKLPSGEFPFFQFVMGSNPSQGWLKTRFILNPNKKTDDFIPSLPKENPHNPDDYEAQLRELFRGDIQYIKAFLEGDWDSVAAPDDLVNGDDLRACFAAVNPIIRHYDNKVVAIDVARYGDDRTVLYGFHNEYPVHKVSYGQKSIMHTVGEAWALEKKLGGRALFVVDDTALGGGVTDALDEQVHSSVLPINFGSQADNTEKYANKRSELFGYARHAILQKMCAIPETDVELHQELAGMKFRYQGDRKFYLESKSEIKKRLGRSPDSADAFVLGLWGCYWLNTPEGMRVFGDVNERKEPAWVKANQDAAWGAKGDPMGVYA